MDYDSNESTVESSLKGIFVTGSDTGVGKSYVATQLVSELYRSGIGVTARKPVESGCERVNGKLVGADTQGYFDALNGSVIADEICPYRYEAALAPPTAARQAGHQLLLKQLIDACDTEEDKLLIVEGAGGFYSPIASDGLNADLAKTLGLGVLVVAANRLGCINHVLLTLQAIASYQLETMAIILNETKPGTAIKDNEESLRMLQTRPVIRVGYQQKLDLNELLLVSGHPLESLNHRIR